jgi:hypothetical protein
LRGDDEDDGEGKINNECTQPLGWSRAIAGIAGDDEDDGEGKKV